MEFLYRAYKKSLAQQFQPKWTMLSSRGKLGQLAFFIRLGEVPKNSSAPQRHYIQWRGRVKHPLAVSSLECTEMRFNLCGSC